MRLSDSVTKNKIELDKKEVSIYLCGPTVYDYAHLGHARSALCVDLLVRVLKNSGFKVLFARNYTDIDDKILQKMQDSKLSLTELTTYYINAYESDMKALNVLEPSFKPKATQYIKEMIAFIENLSAKSFTYKLDDGIYLDTSKENIYFHLIKRDLSEAQSRLEKQSLKRNDSDFVLWKFDDEFYEASFGNGRPGWHTECVAMIESIFKDGVDIHCGGIDLLFPHHENENAQCRCIKDKNLAKIWFHNGFVNIDGEKMSKSLNNSFFVKDCLKDVPAEALRFYLLSSHYKAHFNYSVSDLKASKKRLDKFYRLKKRLNLAEFNDLQEDLKELKTKIAKDILVALSDDLNISKALSLLDEFINEANLRLDKEAKNKEFKELCKESLRESALIFGFGFLEPFSYFQFGLDDEQKAYIKEQISLRAKAKEEKNYALADEIRLKLLEQNIALMDTANGVMWEKIDE